MITKELIEKELNIKLDKNNFSVKKLYGGVFYFFKREIEQDHYFLLEDNKDKLFLLKHDKDNYNPSITETGKQPDSFKIQVDKAESVGLMTNARIYPAKVITEQSNDTKVLILLQEVKERLNQIENYLK